MASLELLYESEEIQTTLNPLKKKWEYKNLLFKKTNKRRTRKKFKRDHKYIQGKKSQHTMSRVNTRYYTNRLRGNIRNASKNR